MNVMSSIRVALTNLQNAQSGLRAVEQSASRAVDAHSLSSIITNASAAQSSLDNAIRGLSELRDVKFSQDVTGESVANLIYLARNGAHDAKYGARDVIDAALSSSSNFDRVGEKAEKGLVGVDDAIMKLVAARIVRYGT